MTTLRTAAQQALEALELGYDSAKAEADQYHAAMAGYRPQRHAQMDADVQQIATAITALKAALAGPEVGGNLPPPLQERNFCSRCGKRTNDIHTCTPPSTEPQCNPHHKAPHGFLRNASHTEDRYVCECEYWDPYEAGYQAGMEAALRAQS